MKNVRDRVAFITGGASGIGLGIAQAFLGAGVRVMIADLREDHIESALASFAGTAQAGRVDALRLDVTDRAAMAQAADETERRFGRVHILVNNAGVGIQGPFEQVTYADWDFGLGVNLGGVVNGLQTFLPRMRAHGEGGHIVSTASLAALTPMPAQFVIYTAAKAAVVNISETIRGELQGQKIGVSVLCPGPVATNIHEVARNRPERFRAGSGFEAAERAAAPVAFPSQMSPADVGQRVLRGVIEDELYIITHGEWRSAMQARHAAILAATPTELDPALVAWLGGR